VQLRPPIRNNKDDSVYVVRWRELISKYVSQVFSWVPFTPVWTAGGSMVFTPSSSDNYGRWRYKGYGVVELWVNNTNVLTGGLFFAGIDDGGSVFTGHTELTSTTSIFYKQGRVNYNITSDVKLTSTFHYRVI